jgi:hypothetical protein
MNEQFYPCPDFKPLHFINSAFLSMPAKATCVDLASIEEGSRLKGSIFQ